MGYAEEQIKNYMDNLDQHYAEHLKEDNNEFENQGRHETLVIRIAEVCQKEIKWVNDCLEENEQKKNYTAEDIIYLPAYKKGFETILTIIGNSV